MIHTGAHVLVYALAAALSPLVLTATFLVIRSERPRTNGIAFLTGFLVGTTIASALGLALGEAVVQRIDSHETLAAVATLLLGVALVVVGIRARHPAPRPSSSDGRAGAILARLGHVRPAAAFSMAALLGFGGPKRLVLTVLAMATITEASLGNVEYVTLVGSYIAVASALVALPVGIVIVAGHRAAAIMSGAQSWASTNAAALRVWLALGVGAALIVDALARLLA